MHNNKHCKAGESIQHINLKLYKDVNYVLGLTENILPYQI